MASENPTSVERSWSRSPHLVADICILCAFALLIFGGIENYWSISHNYFQKALDTCRSELASRAVAVRRFAQRTGRLPESLSECEKDLVRIEEAAPNYYSRVIHEPLSMNPPIKDGVAAPQITQDFLGLPIIYKRGQQKADDRSWFLSSEALPEELELYLKEHGGIPAPSVEPFALSSLFLRDRLALLHGQDMKVMMSRWLLLSGLAIIIVCSIVFAERWRRFSASSAGRVMRGMSVLAIVCGMILLSTTPCRKLPRSIFRSVSEQERLRILDNAVKRGEVPDDVAESTRTYIRKLSSSFNQ